MNSTFKKVRISLLIVLMMVSIGVPSIAFAEDEGAGQGDFILQETEETPEVAESENSSEPEETPEAAVEPEATPSEEVQEASQESAPEDNIVTEENVSEVENSEASDDSNNGNGAAIYSSQDNDSESTESTESESDESGEDNGNENVIDPAIYPEDVKTKITIGLGGNGVPTSYASDEAPAIHNHSTTGKITYYWFNFSESSGLVPGIQYKIRIHIYREADTGDYYYGSTTRYITVPEDGCIDSYGAYIMVDSMSAGRYYVDFILTRNDGIEGKSYHFSGKKAMSQQFYVQGGIASALVNDKSLASSKQAATAFADDLDAGVNIKDRINLVTGYRNTALTFTSYLYHKGGNQELIAGPVVSTARTDSYGSITYDADLGTFTSKDLEIGEEYVIFTKVTAGNEILLDRSSFDYMLQTIKVEDKPLLPEEIPTVITWTVLKTDAETGKALPGAKMMLIKGESPEGEIVGEPWVSGTEPKAFELNPGKYTLVELEAPEGYELASPVIVDLTEDDAYVSGANYTGYTVSNEGNRIKLKKSGTNDEGRIGYCFNISRTWPKEMNSYLIGEKLIYQERMGDLENLETYVANVNIDATELEANLKRVLYLGYPHNEPIYEKDGELVDLWSYFGIDSDRATYITQRAVWKYTDNYSTYFSDESEQAAYEELLKDVEIEYNKNFTLYLYISSHNNYQNVLTWKENSKVMEYIFGNIKKKLEEPPAEETPEEPDIPRTGGEEPPIEEEKVPETPVVKETPRPTPEAPVVTKTVNEKTPSIPNTGDESNAAGWMMLLAISGLGIMTLKNKFNKAE